MTNEPENRNENQSEENTRQAQPKKKNIIRIFRPQNSKTGMIKPDQRPGERKRKPAPGKSVRLGPDGKPLPPRRPRPAGAPVRKEGEPAPAQAEVKTPEAAAVNTEAVKEETAAKVTEKTAVKAEPETVKAAQASPAEVSGAKESKAQPETPEKPAAKQPEKASAEPAGETEKAGEVQAETPAAPAAPAQSAAPEKPVRPLGTVLRRVNMNPVIPAVKSSLKKSGQGSRDGAEGGRRRSSGPVRDRDNREGYRNTQRTEGRTGTDQGAGGKDQDRRRSFGPAREGQGARGGARPGAPAAAMGGKPMEKDSRSRGERGSRTDRNKGLKAEKGDRFDRMEQKQKNAGAKTGGKGKAPAKQPKVTPPVQEEEKIRSITIPEVLTIKELADKMKVQPSAIVKKLFLQGKMVTVNEEIDFETAEEIAIDYEIICEKEVKVDVIEELLKDTEDPEDTLEFRPPVVCVMGHVDHGKTSLLDAIRNTHVIDREAGGITQHIGASVVESGGRKITFLDTPGHEAFTAMRMRGAKSTDIAILVVAADDGVMPQTVEAINHAKAAGIEIIVAINKIDKPAANVDKVKQELTEYELIPEDWGGSTVFCEVSAKTHEGIDNLLEMILLTAEVLELKANPNRRARGLVIEAQLDKGRGPVATVLVQKGTLHVGDPICAGSFYGKVRAMLDDKRRNVKSAGPSTPVEIIGLSGVPNAGEIIVSPATEKEARSFSETFQREGRERLLEETKSKMSLDDLFSQIQAGSLKELNLIVKADVQGSVEAVKQSLLKLSNEEVIVKVIHSGAGSINESDVILASASNAIIIGFNVRPDPQAKSTAEQEGVDVRLYSVIYDAIADVESAMKGLLDPVFEEKVLGHGEVRQTFRASGIGTIAGSYVLDGIFQRGCKARITRDGKQIFDGDVASLKRFKDDVKEVRAGYECGLVFDKFNDVAEGDQIEAYAMVEVPRS